MPKLPFTHIHTYIRWKRTEKEIWYKCTHPDCNHYAALSFLIGKRAICGICNENEIILTKEDLRRAVPRCQGCSNTKVAIRRRRLESQLSSILGTALLEAPAPSTPGTPGNQEGEEK